MVDMFLTGAYSRSLDAKQRFALPKPLRETLRAANQSTLYLAPGTEGSLALYTETAFAELGRQLGGQLANGPDGRAFSRLFYAQAHRVDLDGHGRVRIPSELSAWAALANEVVLLGVRDHMEIWQKERWEAYLGQTQGRYDQITDNAFSPVPKEEGIVGEVAEPIREGSRKPR
ncbi:MAG: division/cell wall cluster transcriptional repressor MraZ [Pirellulaceae bacterium]|jgi:MraZ protein|nr:division/cell wall cluster transcriptional repressor MraZ [Pirellulaceae bacterium]MDP7015907.1 division/cell wall cluster transcriptional repressor MraZ [Pirellulaceae bacterium]